MVVPCWYYRVAICYENRAVKRTIPNAGLHGKPKLLEATNNTSRKSEVVE